MILQKASEQKQRHSILVFGKPVSGKTSLVKEHLLGSGFTPVWLSLNNLNGILGEKGTATWMVGQPSSWLDFKSTVNGLCEDGGGEAIVIDGLNLLVGMALPLQPTQQAWGEMGAKIRDIILALRGSFAHVYVICDVLLNDEGADQIAVNRDLYNKTISLFSAKWFCYTAPDKTGGVIYDVQMNGAMALRLKPIKRK